MTRKSSQTKLIYPQEPLFYKKIIRRFEAEGIIPRGLEGLDIGELKGMNFLSKQEINNLLNLLKNLSFSIEVQQVVPPNIYELLFNLFNKPWELVIPQADNYFSKLSELISNIKVLAVFCCPDYPGEINTKTSLGFSYAPNSLPGDKVGYPGSIIYKTLKNFLPLLLKLVPDNNLETVLVIMPSYSFFDFKELLTKREYLKLIETTSQKLVDKLSQLQLTKELNFIPLMTESYINDQTLYPDSSEIKAIMFNYSCGTKESQYLLERRTLIQNNSKTLILSTEHYKGRDERGGNTTDEDLLNRYGPTSLILRQKPTPEEYYCLQNY